MRCPSCGALYGDSLEESGLLAIDETLVSEPEAQSHQSGSPNKEHYKSAEAEDVEPKQDAKQNSRLIEFPGVSRGSVPQWRA